jgi:hypothetical protein
MSRKISFPAVYRNSAARREHQSTSSGASAFTWKIGAPISLAMLVGYWSCDACLGALLFPRLLLMMIWTAPCVA